jgi:hypothetical protein
MSWGMRLIVSTGFAILFVVTACGSSSSDGTSNGSSSSCAPASSPPSSGGVGPNCASATCDGKKEYCELLAGTDKDGNTTWTPHGCKVLPADVPLPDPSKCAPPDCSADPSACQGPPPDMSACGPDKTCAAIEKVADCKGTTVVTKCAINNGLIGFGCTN